MKKIIENKNHFEVKKKIEKKKIGVEKKLKKKLGKFFLEKNGLKKNFGKKIWRLTLKPQH